MATSGSMRGVRTGRGGVRGAGSGAFIRAMRGVSPRRGRGR